MTISEEAREHGMRATERARAMLKPGDRLLITRCAGIRSTVTFLGWDTNVWMRSAKLTDIHALHVLKVNGVWHSFTDTIEEAMLRVARAFQEGALEDAPDGQDDRNELKRAIAAALARKRDPISIGLRPPAA